MGVVRCGVVSLDLTVRSGSGPVGGVRVASVKEDQSSPSPHFQSTNPHSVRVTGNSTPHCPALVNDVGSGQAGGQAVPSTLRCGSSQKCPPTAGHNVAPSHLRPSSTCQQVMAILL